jgi:hypothetical protein
LSLACRDPALGDFFTLFNRTVDTFSGCPADVSAFNALANQMLGNPIDNGIVDFAVGIKRRMGAAIRPVSFVM